MTIATQPERMRFSNPVMSMRFTNIHVEYGNLRPLFNDSSLTTNCANFDKKSTGLSPKYFQKNQGSKAHRAGAQKLVPQRFAEPASTIAVAAHVTLGQQHELWEANTKYTMAPGAD